MSNAQNAILVVARILLSFMFITSGFGKVTDPATTVGMISQAGIPAAGLLAYVAGLFELLSGLAVLVGFQTRIAGVALALFCVFTGFVFHGHAINVPGFPDGANGYLTVMNSIMFSKNLTLAGAYLLLAIFGPGLYSLDARTGAYKPALA